jgi:hypothetical protein
VQRHALGLLLTILAIALVGVAIAALVGAHGGARWVIALAGFALAGWLGSVALSALRPRH